MYDGYLAVNGVEIINAARVSAYLGAKLPALNVTCPTGTLRTALGHSAYTTPDRDMAPWFRGNRSAAARFYGLFPGKFEGVENSTRATPVVELIADGAVHTMPRHASREIRVVATAFAADEEAMNEGMAWLRDTLAGGDCGDDAGYSCTGRDVKMFTARPSTLIEAYNFARYFYSAEVLSGPQVNSKLVSGTTKALVWEVEFILSAGRPWAFTELAQAASLNMDTAVNFTDPAGEDCSQQAGPYNDFISDPYFTAIAKPPRPPIILPPNLLPLTSWRRLTAPIPLSTTSRWGRVVPVVQISTGANPVQQVRLRFYRTPGPLQGCAYDGEFLIAYVPAHSVLTLDGARQRVSVLLPDGRTVPGGHLLYGSAGRPFSWPSMGCQHGYTMTADMMPGQTGTVVMLDTAVRE